MKKVLLFALIGLVMMGNFTSCKKENIEKGNQEQENQEQEFKEKIIGKWKTYSSDGAISITDAKVVNEYFSDGTVKGTILNKGYWECSTLSSYTIEGDTYTKENIINGNINSSNYITGTIVSITDSYFTLKDYIIPPYENYQEMVFERVTVDYKQAFVGLWEGVSMTGDETYGAANHRWVYKKDGTYVYLTKNTAGEWEADPTNTGNIYYVDGNFFGSRWFKNDVEYREWWDIDYCNETEMRWSALRQKEDGSYFTTTMTMKRVNE